MTSTWLVSPFLHDLLGADVIAQLDHIDPLTSLTCQVCGRVKPSGDPGPMAVIAAATDDGTLVVGLAHPSCRDQVGDLWSGMLDRVEDDEGVDALALFGIRDHVRPRAVLAFEPQLSDRHMLASGDAVDAYVSAHLSFGFTLMTQPLLEVSPALAPGWTLATRTGAITLSHTELGVSYTQGVTDPVRTWLKMARGEGRCLVVTGSGLNIDPAGALPHDFTRARHLGLAVVASVRVR